MKNETPLTSTRPGALGRVVELSLPRLPFVLSWSKIFSFYAAEPVDRRLPGIWSKGCKDLDDRRRAHPLLGSTCLPLHLGGAAVSRVSLEMSSQLDQPASSFLPMRLLKPQVLIGCSQGILLQGSVSPGGNRTGGKGDQGQREFLGDPHISVHCFSCQRAANGVSPK